MKYHEELSILRSKENEAEFFSPRSRLNSIYTGETHFLPISIHCWTYRTIFNKVKERFIPTCSSLMSKILQSKVAVFERKTLSRRETLRTSSVPRLGARCGFSWRTPWVCDRYWKSSLLSKEEDPPLGEGGFNSGSVVIIVSGSRCPMKQYWDRTVKQIFHFSIFYVWFVNIHTTR